MPLSASALSQVCAQVVKTLGFQQYGSQNLPELTLKWSRPWSLRGNFLKDRIRFGGKTPAKARAEIVATLNNPASRREAWIVLGKILSKGALGSEMASGTKRPSALQVSHLIMETSKACRSMGFRLRIFCAH
jgi:hypothetical protein